MAGYSFTNDDGSKIYNIDADQMNANFDNIQTNLLPLGGDWTNTTGVYDVGSNTYRWNVIFCKNINKNNVYQQIGVESYSTKLGARLSVDIAGGLSLAAIQVNAPNYADVRVEQDEVISEVGFFLNLFSNSNTAATISLVQFEISGASFGSTILASYVASIGSGLTLAGKWITLASINHTATNIASGAQCYRYRMQIEGNTTGVNLISSYVKKG